MASDGIQRAEMGWNAKCNGRLERFSRKSHDAFRQSSARLAVKRRVIKFRESSSSVHRVGLNEIVAVFCADLARFQSDRQRYARFCSEAGRTGEKPTTPFQIVPIRDTQNQAPRKLDFQGGADPGWV